MDLSQRALAKSERSSAAARDISSRLSAVSNALRDLNARYGDVRSRYIKCKKNCSRLERLLDHHTTCRQQMLSLVCQIELTLAIARKDVREMEERVEVINQHRRPRIHRNYERRYLLRSIADTKKDIKEQAELLQYKKKFISSFGAEVESAAIKARVDRAQATVELALYKRSRNQLVAKRRRLLNLKRGLKKIPG